MNKIGVPIEIQKKAADHSMQIWKALGADGAHEHEIAPMILALNHVSAKLADFLCALEDS